jgi:hypothetical protein
VCRPVTKPVLLFNIFGLLAHGGQYRTVPRGWFAIWFANSLDQPLSAYPAKAGKLDKSHSICFRPQADVRSYRKRGEPDVPRDFMLANANWDLRVRLRALGLAGICQRTQSSTSLRA